MVLALCLSSVRSSRNRSPSTRRVTIQPISLTGKTASRTSSMRSTLNILSTRLSIAASALTRKSTLKARCRTWRTRLPALQKTKANSRLYRMSPRALVSRRQTILTILSTSSLRLRRRQRSCPKCRLCRHAPLMAISTPITSMSFVTTRALNRLKWISSLTLEQLRDCAQWCACGWAERIKENEEENDGFLQAIIVWLLAY